MSWRGWFGKVVALVLLAAASAASQPAWEAQLSPYERQNLASNRLWMAQRRSQESPHARIAVFVDAGVWHLGAVALVNCLERAGEPCQLFDAERLSAIQGKAGLVLPGGYAPIQALALGQDGLQRISSFVHGGGHCLAVCAGAYLVSQQVRYTGQLFPYPLGLFDGVADGPVSGLAAYPNYGPVRVRVTPAGRQAGLAPAGEQNFLYGGGPRFLGGSNVTALLVYPDGSAAAIRKPIGKGELVATGVHFERPDPQVAGLEGEPPRDSPTLLQAMLRLPHKEKRRQKSNPSDRS